MRPLRFLPPGHLIEVTTRTIHGRLLLRPDRAACDAILGVLGRAQRLYEMQIVAFVFLSNHFHLLLLPHNARQLASFMGYLNSNLAREVGALHRWRQRFWSRRYHAIPVSEEPASQVDRLRYVLAHGAKEGLVASPREWPGPHAITALLEGQPIQGTWIDRTSAYESNRSAKKASDNDFVTTETVTLTPLPCWAGWSDDERRSTIGELLADIEQQARVLRNGVSPLGRARILRQHPHDLPRETKRSPAPAFHAATREAYRLLREAYRIFVDAFRRASERLRAGDRSVAFPQDCFPPALPYVPIPGG